MKKDNEPKLRESKTNKEETRSNCQEEIQKKEETLKQNEKNDKNILLRNDSEKK